MYVYVHLVYKCFVHVHVTYRNWDVHPFPRRSTKPLRDYIPSRNNYNLLVSSSIASPCLYNHDIFWFRCVHKKTHEVSRIKIASTLLVEMANFFVITQKYLVDCILQNINFFQRDWLSSLQKAAAPLVCYSHTAEKIMKRTQFVQTRDDLGAC